MDPILELQLRVRVLEDRMNELESSLREKSKIMADAIDALQKRDDLVMEMIEKIVEKVDG